MEEEKTGEVCKWEYDQFNDFYETECGEGLYFVNGMLEDNKYQFCPYCGREIKEVKA